MATLIGQDVILRVCSQEGLAQLMRDKQVFDRVAVLCETGKMNLIRFLTAVKRLRNSRDNCTYDEYKMVGRVVCKCVRPTNERLIMTMLYSIVRDEFNMVILV